MSSGVRYVFWFIAVLALNYCVIPFSLWLHNANVELTGKTWISVALLILVNVSSVQVYLAIRHGLQKYYIIGLYAVRSEEHTSELQSRFDLVCRLLLEKKKTRQTLNRPTSSCLSPLHRVSTLFFTSPPPSNIYTLSLHDALPIYIMQTLS